MEVKPNSHSLAAEPATEGPAEPTTENLVETATENSIKTATENLAESTTESPAKPAGKIFTNPQNSLTSRLPFLICGLVLSSGAIIGGATLLLKQRSLSQNLSDMGISEIENEIKDLDQAVTRSREEENRIFETEGMNDNFFERANETSNLETKKYAYEEILDSKKSGQPLSTAEDSGQDLLAYYNGSEAAGLTPFINLLFIISPFPAFAGLMFFLDRK